jgi:hypothetical protein
VSARGRRAVCGDHPQSRVCGGPPLHCSGHSGHEGEKQPQQAAVQQRWVTLETAESSTHTLGHGVSLTEASVPPGG